MPEGPGPTGGRLEMLRSKRDFTALQSAGRSRSHPLLIVRFIRNDLGRDRYGISTGRRLGSAVVRNRIRRRIREILRGAHCTGSTGWDILVVARPGSTTATYADLRSALQVMLAPLGHDREGTTRT